MKQLILVNGAAGLALGALLLMFTPFLGEYTDWHIGGERMALGGFVLGLACCLSLRSARRALVSLLAVMVLASAVESAVIVLPAIQQMVPNPISYINAAEQQAVLGCLTGGPFVAAGGVLGVAWNLLRRRPGDVTSNSD